MVEPSSSSPRPERQYVNTTQRLAARVRLHPAVASAPAPICPNIRRCRPKIAPAPATDAPLDQRCRAAEARHPGRIRLSTGDRRHGSLRASARTARSWPRAASTCRPTSGTPTPRACTWRSSCWRPPIAACTCACWWTTWTRAPRTPASRALAAHPNIEVRMFNPFASRSGGLRLAGEGVRDFGRINRRMHNKSWIADNRIALVGGRNLGDEYFSASDEVNFVDLDFAMIGPVVRDVSASFDRFWNSASAWPMEVLDADAVNDAALAQAARQTGRKRRSPRRAAAMRSRCARTTASGAWSPGDWPAAMVGEVSLRLRRSRQGHHGKARCRARRGRRRDRSDDPQRATLTAASFRRTSCPAKKGTEG